MNKQFCPKCNALISNNFGHTPAFCLNCGASANFGQTEKNVSLSETETLISPAPQKLTSQKSGKGLYYLFGCIGLLGTAIILSAVGFLGYWYWMNRNTADNDGKIVPPKTQTVRFETIEPASFDPQVYINPVIINALFDGLLEYNNKNNDLAPSLAEKWEMNADATVWTFSIRNYAKWSDGKPITANDFVYSWRRILNPDKNLGYQGFLLYDIKNAERYNTGKAKADDVGVRALDDFTLQVEMERPTPYFYKMVAMTAFRPVPQAAIEKHGIDWTQPENIVTSGAFKLIEFSPKSQTVVERNPQFWNNSDTKLEKIIFLSDEKVSAGSEKKTSLEIYDKGEMDAVFISPTPEEAVRNRKDFSLIKASGTEFLVFNTKIKPFDDVRVRRAFSLAINREKLKEANLTNFPTDSFLPEIKNYRNANSGGYNPNEARRLLAEAGYPNGQKFAEVEYIYNTTQKNHDIAKFVQAQWDSELNVKVILKNVEWKVFLQKRGAADYNGIARSGWIADFDDPLNFLNFLITYDKNGGGTNWSDKKYVEMVEKANLETDETKRYKMLSDAETYLLEQQPVIPLTVSARGFLCQPYVKNLAPNPLGQINWREVYVEIN